MKSIHLQAILIAVIAVGHSASLVAADPQPMGDAPKANPTVWVFEPAFSDEFDASALDTKKWNTNTEDWGTWSWEPENAKQSQGSLELTMVQETHNRGNTQLFYKSGIARSHDTITYGYFEARVKGCSLYPGACPSFWLHSKGPENRYAAKDGETATYSEIDIVELQQCEWDQATNKHHEVNRIDCNLHSMLLKGGTKQWIRPHAYPEMCKNEYDSPWDPRDDYHVYAAENTKDWVIWYIDGKEIARKPNLYWHIPMHVTLSLGLRYPFEAYKNGSRVPVPDKTTTAGFPTSMSVDYVRVWRNSLTAAEESSASSRPVASKAKPNANTNPGSKPKTPKMKTSIDRTKDEFVAEEKAKWELNGWTWNQAKVESNFAEMDVNQDGIASGKERQDWFAKKKAQSQ